MTSDIVWSPSRDAIAVANITRFAARYGFAGAPYDVLHRWSTSQPDAFWGAIWDFCGVIGERVAGPAYVPAFDNGMIGGQWFPGARLNLAQNLLRGIPEATAVLAADEGGGLERWTHGQLTAEVARVAAGLAAAGVGVGDCVAGVLPNRIEGLDCVAGNSQPRGYLVVLLARLRNSCGT